MSGYAVSLSAGGLVNRLAKALSKLIGNDELTGPLAAVLLYASLPSLVLPPWRCHDTRASTHWTDINAIHCPAP